MGWLASHESEHGRERVALTVGVCKRTLVRVNGKKGVPVEQHNCQLCTGYQRRESDRTPRHGATTAKVWLIDCRSFNERPMVSQL
ncbi:hypothetical protein ID856_11795 [Xenorhabdus sp. 18]|uniref:hypothetical protein n=1 Tax=Xenorhabdus doucetiae TaxID=351671 RepID=UPI0019C43EEF|nr:hypothetical protein [Xenorhabdus sp. 18]MBD2797215.1 hypothetical protein [Xenorhabdus sp. 18]